MNTTLTAQTTDAELVAGINAARARLAHAVTESATSADGLAKLVNELAEAEGAASVHYRYVQVLRHSDDTDKALEVATDTVLGALDDTWSGRGNDVRRANYDGMSKAVRELRSRI